MLAAATGLLPSRGFLRDLADRIVQHDVNGLAAEMAYRFFVALFPFLVFLAAFGAIVADLSGLQEPAPQIVDAMGDNLPDDIASTVESQAQEIIEASSLEPMLLGLIGAIWTASLGMATIIKAVNRIHDVEEIRNLRERAILTVTMTFGGGLLIVLALIIVLLGELSGRQLLERAGFGPAVASALVIARWPLVLLLTAIGAALLYWMAPARPQRRFRWASVGSAVFTLVWTAGSAGLIAYVSISGTMSALYGALAGLLILLAWFYLGSFAFLLGAEVDALLADGDGEGHRSPEPQSRRQP